jgi:penicillin amidase
MSVADLEAARGEETADSLRQRAAAVLAQLDGTIRLPGLRQPVEVLRDRWGVPHIYAQNADDLFFAQGFVAAQDRLWQIDLWRRRAVGAMAEVFGPEYLEADRFARLVKYRGDMQAEWTSYSPDTQHIATAFTRGINACIDHLGDRLPIEFQLLGYRPARWQPEDILGRMAGLVMVRNFTSEVQRAQLVARYGVETARRLAPTDPPRAYAPDPQLDLSGIDLGILAGYRAATAELQLASIAGSNNWVVDGTLSASGKPLLASDPHRAIPLPSLRYLVHLHAPGWHVIGSGEPALPGVAIGHNERIAWGFTIVGTDQSDLFVEQTHPDDALRYRAGDRWETMQVVREKIAVRGQSEPVEVELHFTRHGPVIHRDAERKRAYALRWVGSEPGTAGYLGSLALCRAGNWQQFLDALRAWKLPSENMVYADVDGNIGYVAAALTPIRHAGDGLLPVPGASGRYDWAGFRELSDLPQAFNPPEHFLVTANHNIQPPGYPHALAYEWAPPYRYRRLREVLASGKRFDVDDFCRLQHDNVSLPGRELAAIARELRDVPPDLEPHRQQLAAWDGTLSRDSRAGVLYGLWLQALLQRVFGPYDDVQLLDMVGGRTAVPTLLALLRDPTRDWFPDDPPRQRDALLRETLAQAVAEARRRLGDDPQQWTWGRLHTAAFEHPLGRLGPAHAEVFHLPAVPQAGDGFCPNATRHDATFRQQSGASYRHVFDLADWDRAVATSAPGQSGQPGSPHYADLLELWSRDTYFPLYFSRHKVEQATQHRLVLQPALPH